MAANSRPGDPSVWPSLMTSLVVLALVVSVLSLGVVIDKSHESTGTSAAAATAAAGPGFDFGAGPPDAFKARDPNAPKPSAGAAPTVHKVTFDIEEKQIEIAPGVSQLMWTYNGQVPGPILRGNVGDTFEITLVNHGIDESLDRLPCERGRAERRDADDRPEPNARVQVHRHARGRSICTTAERRRSCSTWRWACTGPSSSTHRTCRRLITSMCSSSPSSTARATRPSRSTTTSSSRKQWDGVAFNGYVNQYADRPIRVPANQKIRVWVVDAGPSDISSFHVIGTIFDTVYKEGEYLLRPDSGHGGSQALDLAPAQGGFVEFSLRRAAASIRSSRTRSPTHAKGAAGVFRATSAG